MITSGGRPLRVLLVHNAYRSAIPSGENAVYEAEVALLREHGVEVRAWGRSNDGLERGLGLRLEAGLLAPANPRSTAALAAVAREFVPDVIHVHNTFPLLSPAILGAARRTGAAVVCTLHNYRVFCAAAVTHRAGRSCLDCRDQAFPWSALRHGCYRGSRLATLPVAVTIAVHRARHTWTRDTDLLVAVSDRERQILVDAGIDAGHIVTKPNPVAPATALPWSAREAQVVFLGRLGEEKGLHRLVEAWSRWGHDAPRLVIIGDGVLRQPLEAAARAGGVGDRVLFAGRLPHDEAMAVLARSRLVVMPSEWEETFGLAIVEGFARGVPAVAAAIGAATSLVRPGVTGELFPTGDAEALLRVIQLLWRDPARMEKMAASALDDYRAHHHPEQSFRNLMAIYDRALQARDRRAGASRRAAP